MQPVLIKPFFPIRIRQVAGLQTKLKGEPPLCSGGRTKNERFFIAIILGLVQGLCANFFRFQAAVISCCFKNLRHIGRRLFLHRHAASRHFGSGVLVVYAQRRIIEMLLHR